MVFEKIKFLASNIAPKPDETTYWVDISANPYGGVIKYYDGLDWIKLDQDSIAEDYLKLRNKPTLNGVVIEGDKTSNDYNIPTPESVELVLNDFRNEINNIDEKVSNVSIKLDNYVEANEGNIEDIKQDIVNIQESLELILGESASDVIDKFNEILSFLEGYDDSQTLKGVISDLEKMINDAEDDISLLEKEIKAALDSHINDYNNPHLVTKEQVGLDQVDNTSDLNKPISTLTQLALDYEANLRDEMDTELMNRINDVHYGLSLEINDHILNKTNPHLVTKELIGLSNVTNDSQVKRSEMGTTNGVATLNEYGLIPSNQLPSYVDDVIDCYATYTKVEDGTLSNIVLYEDAEHLNLIIGESGKIYIDITGIDGAYQFRWTGTLFAVVGAPTVIGEITGTAFDGGRGKALEDKTNTHIADIYNPHNVTKVQVGLGNVDNTSDKDKPVSDATQALVDSTKNELNSSLTSHTSDKNNPHLVTKEQVGLSNVDNTSDLNKPVSTAQQAALTEVDIRITSSLNEHISNTNNPHNVTIELIGAIPTGGLKTINGNSLEGEGNIELSSSGGGIPEAPSDGITYGRKDGSWVEILESGVGKIDPNSDGTGEIFNDYKNNQASGNYSHTEGCNNISYQTSSHAEGNNGIAFGNAAHVEGLGTLYSYDINITSINAKYTTINYTSDEYFYFAPNRILKFSNNSRLYTVIDSNYLDKYIKLDTTTGITIGNTTVYVYKHYAKGPSSHVEGYDNMTTAGYAHAEGSNNTVTGSYGHVEGNFNNVNGKYAHAEGCKNTADGEASHVEGVANSSSGINSHAEGNNTVASGNRSHVEGYSTASIGECSHAEGKVDLSEETPFFSRTRTLKLYTSSLYITYIMDSLESQFVLRLGELFKCNDIIYKVTYLDYNTRLFLTSPNIADNIEISNTSVNPTEITIEPVTKLGSAIGTASHHEGTNNCAYGTNSHVGGNGCLAIGNNSFAHGKNLIAGDEQAVFGKYNLYEEDALFQVGCGNDQYKGRANALSVSNDGVTTANRIKTYSITVSDKLISSNNITIGNSTTNLITSASKGLIITDGGNNKITYDIASGDTTYLIIGESNKVSGRGFIVVGNNNNASRSYSNNSICVGLYNTIYDSQSIAVGYNCAALGNATVAFGGGGIILTTEYPNNNVELVLQLYESTYSLQEDSIHVAFAKQSMVTGKNNLALGLLSMSNGQGNVAKNDLEFVVGSFNDYSSDTNNLFVVGNGTSHTSRGNAFVVTRDGVQNSSDINLKDNITDLKPKGELRLVEFDWKNTGRHSYGFIAQEVELIYPEMVSNNGLHKMLNYNEAICAKIAELLNRIIELEKLILK